MVQDWTEPTPTVPKPTPECRAILENLAGVQVKDSARTAAILGMLPGDPLTVTWSDKDERFIGALEVSTEKNIVVGYIADVRKLAVAEALGLNAENRRATAWVYSNQKLPLAAAQAEGDARLDTAGLVSAMKECIMFRTMPSKLHVVVACYAPFLKLSCRERVHWNNFSMWKCDAEYLDAQLVAADAKGGKDARTRAKLPTSDVETWTAAQVRKAVVGIARQDLQVRVEATSARENCCRDKFVLWHQSSSKKWEATTRSEAKALLQRDGRALSRLFYGEFGYVTTT